MIKRIVKTLFRIRNKLLKYSHQRKRPERAVSKWHLMKEHLSQDVGSLLDIGCNEGYFTREAGRLGWCAWGLDSIDHTVKYASTQAMRENLNNVFFSVGKLDISIAQRLPKFDVILLTSVYQEIFAAFGQEEAYLIFDNLLRACNKQMFFEPSSINQKYGEGVRIFDEDNDVNCVEQWVKGLVARSEISNVRLIGKTEYTKKEPYRYMFLIEK